MTDSQNSQDSKPTPREPDAREAQSIPDPNWRPTDWRAQWQVMVEDRDRWMEECETWKRNLKDAQDDCAQEKERGDRLAAEVGGLRKDYAKVRELSQQRGLQLQTARAALEMLSTGMFAESGEPVSNKDVRDITREALAAMDALSPGEDKPDLSPARDNRPDAAVTPLPDSMVRWQECGPRPANEPVTNCGAASPPPGAVEHAALLKVAEAAEALWALRDEAMMVWIDPVIGVGEALAELRRARGGK